MRGPVLKANVACGQEAKGKRQCKRPVTIKHSSLKSGIRHPQTMLHHDVLTCATPYQQTVTQTRLSAA